MSDTHDVASPELSRFLGRMDELVERERDAGEITEQAAGHLLELLQAPQCVPPSCRVPASDRYAQHIVHVHPDGLYSLVSLVWMPGQATPIHDHRCWCLVGVLQGVEEETRYQLRSDGAEDWLVVTGKSYAAAGTVTVLVPPAENIHHVVNAGTGRTISLHVYGADIQRCGTSINRVFDQPVRDRAGGQPVPWRAV